MDKTEEMEAAIRSAVYDGLRHADDPEFMAAWETLGFQYSESNIDKVHIGWRMAKARPAASEGLVEAAFRAGFDAGDPDCDRSKEAENDALQEYRATLSPASHDSRLAEPEWLNMMPRAVVARYAFSDGCREQTHREIYTGHYGGIKLKAEMVVDMVGDLQNDTREALATLSPSHDSRLADELERLLAERGGSIAYRGDVHDAVAFAAHAERYRQSAIDLAQFVSANGHTILAALRSTPAPDALRAALEPFARYFELNNLAKRPDDDAIEVPVRDLRIAHYVLRTEGSRHENIDLSDIPEANEEDFKNAEIGKYYRDDNPQDEEGK